MTIISGKNPTLEHEPNDGGVSFCRRIWYGNATHVNVSVIVGEDNKANLYVALDRKDKDYFACDAGCLDAPVELTIQKTMFPVKVTDPLTSVLYITSDRRHAEELHLSIHVKEIVEGTQPMDLLILLVKRVASLGNQLLDWRI